MVIRITDADVECNSAIYQCASPSVREGIRKTSENILARSCILLPWIVVQVDTVSNSVSGVSADAGLFSLLTDFSTSPDGSARNDRRDRKLRPPKTK